MVAESVAYMRAAGRRVVFDAEHFFDGYRADRGYALAVLAAAAEAGADTLALCDTNGGTLPDDVARDRGRGRPTGPSTKVGVHFHNDAACAVANSVVAVAAGGLHVQGAANGYGERCGNADLFSVIASLELKRGHELLPPGRLARAGLHRPDHRRRGQPAVRGAPALRRVRRRSRPRPGCTPRPSRGGRTPTPTSSPAAVGNQPQVLVSELAGRSNVLAKAAELGLDLSTDPGLAGRVLDQVKEAEYRGYAFEAADASFELLVRKTAGLLPTWFELEGYRVVIERGAGRRTAARPSSGCGSARTGWWPSARASARCTRWTRRCAARWSSVYPALERHPPGRLQGAHPGRPGGDQRRHPGHAHLGRRRGGVDDGRGVRRHRHRVLGGAGRRGRLRPAARGRRGDPRRPADLGSRMTASGPVPASQARYQPGAALPRPRSGPLTTGPSRAPARAMLRAVGLSEEDLGRPQVAVASSWNEVTPVQCPPERAGRGRQGGRPAGRGGAAGVRHDRGLGRHLDGHRGHEGLAGQPGDHRRLRRADGDTPSSSTRWSRSPAATSRCPAC